MNVTPNHLTSIMPNAPVCPRVEVRRGCKAPRSLCFEHVFITNKADHHDENDDDIKTPTGDMVEELNLAMAIAQSLNDQ